MPGPTITAAACVSSALRWYLGFERNVSSENPASSRLATPVISTSAEPSSRQLMRSATSLSFMVYLSFADRFCDRRHGAGRRGPEEKGFSRAAPSRRTMKTLALSGTLVAAGPAIGNCEAGPQFEEED